MIKDAKFYISPNKDVTFEINKRLNNLGIPAHIIVGIHHELITSYKREVTIYYKA